MSTSISKLPDSHLPQNSSRETVGDKMKGQVEARGLCV